MVKFVTPVPPVRTAPPEAAAYQSMVSPAPAVAVSNTVPVPQRALSVPVARLGTAFMVAVALTRVAERQPVVVFLTSAK